MRAISKRTIEILPGVVAFLIVMGMVLMFLAGTQFDAAAIVKKMVPVLMKWFSGMIKQQILSMTTLQ